MKTRNVVLAMSQSPDHLVRRAAVKRLIDLMGAGRPVPKHVPAEDSDGISLEQLTFWANSYWASKAEESPNQDGGNTLTT